MSHTPLPRLHFVKVKGQIERMRVQSDKSKMASVRGYSEMSQYAPRPPEGVWGFVNSKCCYELVEEAGRTVQRVWLACSGGLRLVLRWVLDL